MKRMFLYVTLLMIISVSCEKNVKIEIPQKDPKLVIKGLLEKDELVGVRVGKSKGILDVVRYQQSLEEQFTVKDAEVVLYENGTAVDTLIFQPLDYIYKTRRNTKIKPNVTYTLRAKAPGFTMAEAVSIMPSQSVIAETKWVRNVRTNSSGVFIDEVTIKLNDPIGEKNFYLVQLWGGVGGTYGNVLWCVGTTDKDIEAPADIDPLDPDNCYDGNNMLMRDDNFNGSLKQLKLTADTYELNEYTEPNGKIHRPYVKVYRITEDQFKYVKSYNAYLAAGDNPFAEPSNVFSNVKNGYGIFAVSTMAVDTLR